MRFSNQKKLWVSILISTILGVSITGILISTGIITLNAMSPELEGTCNRSLHVHVQGQVSGYPLEGATVFVARSSDLSFNWTAQTDDKGDCSFVLQKNKNYLMNVTCQGHYPHDETFYFKIDEQKVVQLIALPDTSPPSLENFTNSWQVDYGPDQVYRFEVTSRDLESGVDTVLLTFNATEYAMNDLGNHTYNFTLWDLPAGTYNFHVVANNTIGLLNVSATNVLQVQKVSPTLSLLLNGSSSNVPAFVEEEVNITARSDVPGLLLRIYINESLSASGTDIEYFTNFSSAGVYRVQLNTSGDENHTDAVSPLYITVTDLVFSDLQYQNGSYVPSKSWNITVNVSGDVDTVLLNFSSSIHVMSGVGSTYSYSVSDLGIGDYFFHFIANDTQDNQKITPLSCLRVTQAFVNFTLIIQEYNFFRIQAIENASTNVFYYRKLNVTLLANATIPFNLTIIGPETITLQILPGSYPIYLSLSGEYRLTLQIVENANYSAPVLHAIILRHDRITQGEGFTMIFLLLFLLGLIAACLISYGTILKDKLRRGKP